MYKVMMCTTQNPFGEVLEYDCEDMHAAKCFWKNFFSKQLDKFSAGISVYSITESGSLGETLANWQPDGENCFCNLEAHT